MNKPAASSEQAASDLRLERLMDRTLRGLPLRRAPHTLEWRVFDELERRASQPWWRHSFAHWPWFARASFVLACSPLVGLALLGSNWVSSAARSVDQSNWLPLAAARQVAALIQGVGELARLLASAVPPAWQYAGLTAGAVLYALLFGLGAAAYRTLYLKPLDGR